MDEETRLSPGAELEDGDRQLVEPVRVESEELVPGQASVRLTSSF
jgi:hypothetical protein